MNVGELIQLLSVLPDRQAVVVFGCHAQPFTYHVVEEAEEMSLEDAPSSIMHSLPVVSLLDDPSECNQ
jgi:hypothetical protein